MLLFLGAVTKYLTQTIEEKALFWVTVSEASIQRQACIALHLR